MRFSVQDEYQQLAHQLAHRPTASEFFYHGIEISKVRKQAQSWFHLVASQEMIPSWLRLLHAMVIFFCMALKAPA